MNMDATTQSRILEAGKAEFLAKGFEPASLRAIAKEAGVTTGAIYGYYPDKAALFGALVSEPAQQLRAFYLTVQQEFDALPPEVKARSMHDYSARSLEDFIGYIYEHFDAFKLVVSCSARTEYEHYIDSLIEVEVYYTQRYISAMREVGHDIPVIEEQMNHILSSAQYYGIFETVAHDMSKEKALQYIRTLYDFYSAGWDAILGLK
ncbi:MAG: TetR/AcrR family transcriptional regulator [Oscillospiraceae bacterium]|nr:TetR/AcrR family transcriptional regulator [Oscillospiraceae bacterium]